MGCTHSKKKYGMDLDQRHSEYRNRRPVEECKIFEKLNSFENISVSSRVLALNEEPPELLHSYHEIANKMSENNEKHSHTISINGLVNSNNTCFINAALQCVFRMQPLIEYFMSQLQNDDMVSQASADDKSFIQQFANLLATYHFNNEKNIRIEEFCLAIQSVFPGYVIGTQEDAHEFLVFLFDKIHNCLNRAHKSSKKIEKFHQLRRVNSLVSSINKEVDSENRTIRAWQNYLTLEKSIIVGGLSRYFSGANVSKDQVPKLQYQLIQLRASHVLHIAFPAGGLPDDSPH
jgi:ubiquitin C-terminal hydrolase